MEGDCTDCGLLYVHSDRVSAWSVQKPAVCLHRGSAKEGVPAAYARMEGGRSMAFDIEEELKKLPAKPGVYLMHDERDAIIYVGKAISP